MHQRGFLGDTYLSIGADNFYLKKNDPEHWISFGEDHKKDAILLIDNFLDMEINSRHIMSNVEKRIGMTGTPSHLFGNNVFTLMSGKPGKHYLVIHDTYTQHYHAYTPEQAIKLRELLAKTDLDDVVSNYNQSYAKRVRLND